MNTTDIINRIDSIASEIIALKNDNLSIEDIDSIQGALNDLQHTVVMVERLS